MVDTLLLRIFETFPAPLMHTFLRHDLSDVGVST